MAGPTAKIMLVDYDLAATTRITKGTRETRVSEKTAAMIAARREEMTGTTVGVTTSTWSRQAITTDATSEMATGVATAGTHAETTNAAAPKALEATGHPA